MKKELVVGVFFAVGLLAFIITVLVIKDVKMEKGYFLSIYFEDAGNLMEKAWVRTKGVKIGKVERIELENEKAKVVVWIKDFVKIHSDATAKITSTGVLGVKYVEIDPGSKDEPLLKNGGVISSSERVVSLDDMLSEGMTGIKDFTQFLRKISQKEDVGDKIGNIIANIERLSERLNEGIDETSIRNTIKYLETAGKDIKDILEPNKENIKESILSLKNVSTKIDKFSESFTSTETVLGQLAFDKESGQKVAQTFESLKVVTEQATRTLNRINFFQTYWDYKLRYDTKNLEYKNDIGLNVYPSDKKFYYLSVDNVSSSKQESSCIEPSNTFSIGIGGRFFDSFIVYGGLIRSTGGFGVKIFPFGYKARLLEVGSEVYDFSKEKNMPRLDLSVKLEVMKWLYIGSRYEDVSDSQSLNTFMNISFKDEDIAYLLGLIGLSR